MVKLLGLWTEVKIILLVSHCKIDALLGAEETATEALQRSGGAGRLLVQEAERGRWEPTTLGNAVLQLSCSSMFSLILIRIFSVTLVALVAIRTLLRDLSLIAGRNSSNTHRIMERNPADHSID